MNIAENFEKLQCANLQKEKEVLQKQLKMLYEQPMSGVQTTTANQLLPMMQGSKIASKKQIKKIGRGQAESEDTPKQPGQFDMAQPHQGFALTPQSAETQKYMLTTYFDRPETLEQEQAQEPTWQNLQQSISNYVGSQVNDLIRKQRMLG